MKRQILFHLLALLALAGSLLVTPAQAQRMPAPAMPAAWPQRNTPLSVAGDEPATPAPARIRQATPPLSFVPNAGQSAPAVRFLAHGQGGTLFFAPREVVFRRPGAALRLRFQDANPAPQVTGGERLPGIVNYFIGDDLARWRTNLPTYAALTYRELYPGVDLRYEGAAGALKGTYVVAPGADPARIRWRYDGAASVRLDPASGDLLVQLPFPPGYLVERAPIAWQEPDGRRVPVRVGYRVAADGSIGFALGDYDPTYPLVLDPMLDYSTYLGGSGDDYGNAIAVDGSGNVYVAGQTASLDFPTQNPYQGANAGGSADVFVTKLSAGGALVYSTYLGGSDRDIAWAIAVDPAGQAYLAGDTSSANFPTVDPLQPFGGGIAGGGDAFIAKLGPAGNTLAFSTWLGGGYSEYAMGIAVDPAGDVYVTGYTNSTAMSIPPFPVTPNAYQPSFAGGPYDAFVTKIALAPTPALAYSTYFGGSNTVGNGFDSGRGIAVDASGLIYVTGQTGSQSDFPIKNAYDPSFNGGANDAFIARFDPAQSGAASLLSSTFFGGNNSEYGSGLALGASNTVYIAGGTTSTNLPLQNAYQSSFGGGDGDAFVARFDSGATSLLYGSYLGGSGLDVGQGVAVDGSGNACLNGWTESSADWPVKNALQPTFGGGAQDAFVARFDPGASGAASLIDSTYLGGSGDDKGGNDGMAASAAGVYVAGSTNSADFPLAAPYQGAIAGGYDAFVAKIVPRTDLAVSKSDSADPTPIGSLLVYTVVVTNTGDVAVTGALLTDTLPGGVAFAFAAPSQGICAQAGGVIGCDLGPLNVADRITVTIGVTTTAVGVIVNVAEVTANEPDVNPSNNLATQDTTVVAPDLQIAKAAAPAPAVAGAPLTYTLTYTNAGSAVALEVYITDTLPASVTFDHVIAQPPGLVGPTLQGQTLVWYAPTLVDGAGGDIVLRVAVDAGATGVITNHAAIANQIPESDLMNNAAEAPTLVVTEADLAVTKTDTPDPVLAGGVLTYTLHYTHSGPSHAQVVVITDTLPAGVAFGGIVSQPPALVGPQQVGGALVWQTPALAAGDGGVIVFTATVGSGAGSVITNDVEIVSATPDPAPGNNWASEATVVGQPDLVVSKTDSADPAGVDMPLTYTVVVTNVGNIAATNVLVTDTLLSSESIGQAIPGQGTCYIAQSTAHCSLGTVAVGADVTVRVVLTPTQVGVITNTVVVSSDGPDANPANNAITETTFATTPDLAVSKVDSADPATVGNVLTYTVTITNAGPGPAWNVTLTDTVEGETIAYAIPDHGSCHIAQSTAHCSLGALPVGATTTVRVKVIPTQVGVITNTAQVANIPPDANPADNTAVETTTVGLVDLQLWKTDAPDPATVGHPFTYTLLLLNNGPGVAQGVRLTDTLPAGVAVARIVPGIGFCNYAQPGRDIYCNLGDMAWGEMGMVTVIVTPTAAGMFTNTVWATATNGDAHPANNAALAATTVGHAAVTVGPAAGGVLTYTDSQGNATTAAVPAGAVTATTTLLYTALPTTTAALPSGFAFAGHAFTLDAYRNGAPLAGLAFQLPVTLTLHYSEADVAGLDESALALNYWDGSRWADVATTCAPPSVYDRHPDQNWLAVPLCHLTEFALFGRTGHRLYLPLVVRNH